MARHLDIVKEDGRWKVIRDDRKEKFQRGQDLTWTLNPDPDDPDNPVAAHFQFTDGDLIENQPKNTELTEDWTAAILVPGKKLHVKVKDLADRPDDVSLLQLLGRDIHVDGQLFLSWECLLPAADLGTGLLQNPTADGQDQARSLGLGNEFAR